MLRVRYFLNHTTKTFEKLYENENEIFDDLDLPFVKIFMHPTKLVYMIPIENIQLVKIEPMEY